MIKIKQDILHDPDNGFYGNCAQAAFASILELPLNEVPHFADGLSDSLEDGSIFDERIRDWLRPKKLGLVGLSVGPDNLEGWLEYLSKSDTHHLIAGKTVRGFQHITVGFGGKIVHDPHPSDTGLLPPTEDNLWTFEFFIILL